MKYIRYCLTLVLAVALASCQGNGGSGDATVGFDRDNYEFSESEGTVKVPVVFTGEPAKYPITFSISASVDGGAELSDVANFVQVLSSMRYNGKGDVVLEIELKDNFDQNPDRHLTLEIVSADGAEIVRGKTVLTIKDNDGDIYQALQGKWTFRSTLADDSGNIENGQVKMFDVLIDAGGSSSEIAENTRNRRLRVLGWEGYDYTDDDPAQPFVWYLEIKYNEQLGREILWTVPEISLVDSPGDPLGIGCKPCEIRLGLAEVKDNKVNRAAVNLYFELPAEWSEDRRTISFAQNRAIIPLIYKNGTFTNAIWNVHANVTLTR